MSDLLDGEFARLIVESASDFAIIAMAPDGTVLSWNPGAEKLLGWSTEEALGMDGRAIFTPEDREAETAEDEMRRAVGDGRALDERWHVRRDGSRFWGSGLMMPLRADASGEARGFLKIVRDRTAERDAERRYHTMSAALPCFMFVADADGHNTETNSLFQTYTGRSAAELEGDRWLEVLHEDDRARAAEAWGRAVAAGETYGAQYRFRRHDGEHRWFACRGVPERDGEGRIVGWLGTCIDVEGEASARGALERLNLSLEHRVTQGRADLAGAIEDLQTELANRARVEEALRQSQKMEAIGQLTGGVAHDFNNLLTVIRSSSQLLLRPGLPEERRRRYIEAIAETTDRAAALTRQLLAFARRQPLQPEVFDAGERVRGMAAMLKTTAGSRLRIVIDTASDACAVQVDPNQFDTALLNMAVNARDAMDGEGEMRIAVAAASGVPARRAHAPLPGDYVTVSVADTGTGIPPDRIGRVFEPFFTTKEVGKGTGLGLSQVFGFVKQSGGDITVESEPGRGATFMLHLPRAAAAPAAAELSAAVEPLGEAAAGDGCVLVVEDNQEVGEFAVGLLEDLGYTALWASGADTALKLVEAIPERFDAVFSDVVMPGMSGIELARRLRRERPELPVVLTSGYSHVLAQEGTSGFELLHKPYSVDGLSRVLEKAMNGGRAGSA